MALHMTHAQEVSIYFAVRLSQVTIKGSAISQLGDLGQVALWLLSHISSTF